MYDSVAVLKQPTTVTYDTAGNESIVYTDKTVYVQQRSVYQSEFYNAAQLGLHPSIVLILSNRQEYSNEKLVEFEGTLYNVIRADWDAQRDKVSLTCEERVGNG